MITMNLINQRSFDLRPSTLRSAATTCRAQRPASNTLVHRSIAREIAVTEQGFGVAHAVKGQHTRGLKPETTAWSPPV